MKRCDYCGSSILLGGKHHGVLSFCDERCATQAPFVMVASSIPESVLRQEVWSLHHGNCPRCGGAGPVELYTTHRAWSALLFTSWESRPVVSCRSCATKRRMADTLFTLCLGWWGFPWGLVMTPVQIGRNMVGFFKRSGDTGPSKELTNLVRVQMAARAMAARSSD